MANRYPLIVNPNSNKIEELGLSDNLNLTQNNIVADNATGTNGQYLKSDGTKVVWDFPGDVYLTTTQTLTNKTFTSCTINASNNTISNIANSSLTNSSITINGSAISLGGSVTTPNDNTTYNLTSSALSESQIAIQLDGSDSGLDRVILEAGANTSLTRTSIPDVNGNSTSYIRIDSSDTTATYSPGNGLELNGSSFALKDNSALLPFYFTRWDNTNKKLIPSNLRQDPTSGNITLENTASLTSSSTLQGSSLISSLGSITLRKGNNLTGADGRLIVVRTTGSTGTTQSFTALQWYESGGYWRVDDGSPITSSNTKELITATDNQSLVNKTLVSPTLKAPLLDIDGAAVPTATELVVSNQLTASLNFTCLETSNLNKVTRTSTGLLGTVLPVVSGVAAFDTSVTTQFIGSLQSPVTTWRFNEIDASKFNTTTEITLILQGNPTNTYGDSIIIGEVGGSTTTVTGGVRWVGGNIPTASTGIDVLKFKIIVLFPLEYIILGSYELGHV